MYTFIKITFTFSVPLFFWLSSFGQSSNKVKLEWKFLPNETLKYFLISKSDSDTSKAIINDTSDFYKSGALLFTLLENKNYIDIISTAKREKEDTLDFGWFKGDTLSDETMSMNNDTRNAHLSNMTALFFQLPHERIKVGDVWSLKNVCFFMYRFKDSSFYQEGDTVYKINRITLTDLKQKDSETIAVIKYNLEEYAGSHTDSLNNKNSGIRYKYTAIGRFSIEKGRWVSYEATLFFYLNEKLFGDKTSETTINMSLVPVK